MDKEIAPVPLPIGRAAIATAPLTALLARVEAATEPTVDLFIAVAVNVYPVAYPSGWVEPMELADWRFLKFEKFLGAGAWTDAALALVERVKPGWQVNLSTFGGAPIAEASLGARGAFPVQQAPTAPLALLAALQRSLIADSAPPGDGLAFAHAPTPAPTPASPPGNSAEEWS